MSKKQYPGWRLGLISVLLCLFELGLAQEPALNTPIPLKNGAFEQGTEGADWPVGWNRARGGAWVREAGNSWVALEVKPGGGRSSMRQYIAVHPTWSKLELRLRMRLTDVKIGADRSSNARVGLTFLDPFSAGCCCVNRRRRARHGPHCPANRPGRQARGAAR